MALWWLLPAGVAPVGLVGVPFACEVGRFACGSGAWWAFGVPFPYGAVWAYQRRGKGVGVAKVQERDALTTERYAGKRPARDVKGLKPVKRQP